MSGLEARLRDGLRNGPKDVPGQLGEWGSVRARALRRRRRSLAMAVAAVIAVAVAGIGFLLTAGGGGDRRVVAGPGGQPSVVAVANGRVVVLDPSDGHVLRTLAGGRDAATVTALAPTPDGSSVYLGSSTPTCGAVPGGAGFAQGPPTITRVSAHGGPVELVAAGWQPHVSPDGRYLGYATARGDTPTCLHYDVLVVRDLTTGTEHRFDFGPDQQTIAPVAWSPDSTRILAVGPGAGPHPYSDLTVTPTGLQPVGQPAAPLGFGPRYLPDGELVYGEATATSTRIETIDPTTGNITRRIATLSAPLELIDVDRAGIGYLLIGPPTDLSVHNVYRASIGQPAPAKLLAGATTAAWLASEQTRPTEPTSTPTGAVRPKPASILAHVITPLRGGYRSEVVELASTRGQIQHVLAPVPGGVTSYAIAADQRSVYVDGFNEQLPGGIPCPDQAKHLTSLLRIPRSGGQPVLEATGTRPALSPDNTKLAYLRADCGTRNQPFVPSTLAIRPLGTGTQRRWSLPPPYTDGNSFGFENIGPLEWAPDGTHLLTRVVSGGQPGAPPLGPTNWWLVDTTAPSGRLHAAELPIPNRGPDAPLDIIALGSTGRWAALLPASSPGGPLRVVDYDPTRGRAARLLTTLGVTAGDTAHLVAADPSGQHLLLIVHIPAPTTPGSTVPDQNDLYQWNVGDPQPTKLAPNVVAATW